MFPAHPGQLPVPLPQLQLFLTPGISTPVIRIRTALHSGFIPVVDAGNPRQGKLPQSRQLYPLQGHTLSYLGAKHRQEPGYIMAAQDIQHRRQILGRIIFAQLAIGCRRSLSILLPQDKIQERLPEHIVHDPVQLVPAQISALLAVADLVAGVFPHLADKQGFRVFRLQGLVKLFQKSRRQFVRHIQAPAANALPEPVFKHAVLTADNKIQIGGRGLFHFGQHLDAPPALVIVRILVELVPGIVRRVLGLVGPGLGIGAVFIKIAAVVPGMAKNAVQDQAQAACLSLPAQSRKFGVGTQETVNIFIIAGVVTVVAAAGKDGIQVQQRHAQVLQVGQLGRDSRQVAAKKVVLHHVTLDILAVAGRVVPAAVEHGAVFTGQLRRSACTPVKTVRKNLIGHRPFSPGRRHGIPVVHRHLVGRRFVLIFSADPTLPGRVVAVVPGPAALPHFKIVPEQAACLRHNRGHRIEFLVPGRRRHRHQCLALVILPQTGKNLHLVPAGFLHPQAQSKTAAGRHGAKRTSVTGVVRIVK